MDKISSVLITVALTVHIYTYLPCPFFLTSTILVLLSTTAASNGPRREDACKCQGVCRWQTMWHGLCLGRCELHESFMQNTIRGVIDQYSFIIYSVASVLSDHSTYQSIL